MSAAPPACACDPEEAVEAALAKHTVRRPSAASRKGCAEEKGLVLQCPCEAGECVGRGLSCTLWGFLLSLQQHLLIL